MLIGMFCGVFAGVAGLTLSSPAPAVTPRAHPTAQRAPVAPAPGEVYSLRARRRFAAYLRLRLLEMRKAGLERAADVVEHRLPVETLVGR